MHPRLSPDHVIGIKTAADEYLKRQLPSHDNGAAGKDF
jgi:hypothetical protein